MVEREGEVFDEMKVYSRGKCWKKGGLKALLKETSLFDCIGETICPHIVECYRGMMRSGMDGGDRLTDDEIRAWAEEQRKGLNKIMKWGRKRRVEIIT